MIPAGKPEPNRARYLQTLAAMSPDQRLRKAFELSAWTRELSLAGLRDRYPELDADELRRLEVERRLRCHRKNS